MKRSRILTGLAAGLLSIGLALAGCEGPTGADGAPGSGGGGGGINAPNIVSTEAGIRAAFADGAGQVYLVGPVTLEDGLTIPAGRTLVVTATGDIASRSVGSGTGSLTVGAEVTLLVNGNLTVDAGRTFALADDTAGIVLDDAAVVTIGAGAAFTIPEGAIVAYDNAVITGAGKTEAIAEELAGAKANSPVQYTATQASLAGLFSNVKVETVIYGGTAAVGALSHATKDLVLTNAGLGSNTDNAISVRNLLVSEGVTLTFGNAALTIAETLVNNGTIVSAKEGAGGIALGAGTLANTGTITLTAADGTITSSKGQTNAGTIANHTTPWTGNPLGYFDGTTADKTFTNNGAIETTTVTEAVLLALVTKPVGTGKVVLKGVLSSALSGAAALTQNIEVASGGELKTNDTAKPFTNTALKTVTINDTGKLTLAVSTNDLSAVTLVVNGSDAAAVGTATVTLADLGAILTAVKNGGGSTLNVTASADVNGGAGLSVPAGIKLVANTATLATTTGTLAIGAGANVSATSATLAATGTVTVGEGATLTLGSATFALAAGVAITVETGGKLDLAAATNLAIDTDSVIETVGTGKIAVSKSDDGAVLAAIIAQKKDDPAILTVELTGTVGLVADAAIPANVTVIVGTGSTLSLTADTAEDDNDADDATLTLGGAIVVKSTGTLELVGGDGYTGSAGTGGAGGEASITGSGTISVENGGALTVTAGNGGAGTAGGVGTHIGGRGGDASIASVTLGNTATVTVTGGDGGVGGNGGSTGGAGGDGGDATVSNIVNMTGSPGSNVTTAGGTGGNSGSSTGSDSDVGSGGTATGGNATNGGPGTSGGTAGAGTGGVGGNGGNASATAAA